ncbi:cadherin-like domain-containing protein, partial [Ramlibacter sp.]|uniref:cadherin-like domain-containing protein n=1 Tax=Ramlibacter sp. TaxID=1917967 RepID=UPI002C955CA2
DVESDALVASALAIASGSGTLVNNGDGSWSYTPALNDDSAVSFSYTIADNGTSNGVADPRSVAGTASLDITPVNDAPTDLILNITVAPSGNSLPSGAFGQMSVVDPDGGAAPYVYSLLSLTATTLAGAAAANFAGDLTVGSTGAVSASNMDADRVYEMTVQVQQGTGSYSEAFSLITGTNAGNTVAGTVATGDDVIYGQGGGDLVFAGSGDDTVFGQNGDDEIHGGAGNDVLAGGGNNDSFQFDTALDALTNVDTITDFVSGADSIVLENTGAGLFNALAAGALAPAAFTSGAVTASTRIIYDTATGWLSYDADGSGAGAAVHFATLVGAPALAAASFTVI